MLKLVTLLGVLIVAASAIGVASAATASGPYRTEHQAEHYLEHGLKRWAGINLRYADFKFAFCTGTPFLSTRTNRAGEYIYNRFKCSLSVNSRTFNLRVRTAAHGWYIRAGA